MANNTYMEILDRNYCQTTTQFVVNSNTVTVENLLNPDTNIQYYTDGFDNDATTCSITISFDSTQTVSRIALLQHNWKKFNIYYGGVTANAFAMTSTSSTMTSQWINNSETSQYIRCTPVACTSVTFDIYSTQAVNSEKAIGHLMLSDVNVNFSRMPNADSYKPKWDPEQVVHQMSDGGFRLHTVRLKYMADIKLKYVTKAFRDELVEVWRGQNPFLFVPFGTTTSWDAIAFEAIWPGAFDFYTYSDDALSSGFSGTISLRETTS